MSRNQYGDHSGEVLAHGHLLSDFLEYVTISRTKETADCYKDRLRTMVRTWDAIPPEKWDRTLFEKYIVLGKRGGHPWQGGKGWGTRTLQLLLVAAKLFGTYLREHGRDVPEFWLGVKKPPLTQPEAKFLTLAEVKRLLEAASGTRYELVVSLAFGASMRRGEIWRSRYEDVSWEDGAESILVRREKTHLHSRIPLSPILRDVLQRYRKDEKGADRAGLVIVGGMSNCSRDIKALCLAAKVPVTPLHGIGRHSSVTHMISHGVPGQVVTRLAGWSPSEGLKRLGRYAHALPGAEVNAMKLLV